MKLVKIRSATDTLRDTLNWLAVFRTEYGLSDEAYKVLKKTLESIGKKMDLIVCKTNGVDEKSIRPAADALRDAKDRLAVFQEEYDIPNEAVKVLSNEFAKFARKLNAIECKK